MLDQVYSKLVKFKKIWGIHIHESEDGEYCINAVLLVQKKGVIYLQERKAFYNIDDIAKFNVPVSLSYSSKKVLDKKVEEYSDKVLQSLLHTDQFEEFYVQVFEQDEFKFISVLRKNQIDSLLDIIKEKGIQIVSVAIGPVNIYAGLPFMEIGFSRQKKQVGNFSITIENEKIVDITTIIPIELEEVSFGGESISSGDVLPYCNALIIFTGKQSDYIRESEWEGMEMEAKYGLFYKKFLPISLISIFAILAFNYGILSYQTSQHNKLLIEYTQYQNKLNELDELKQNFNDKQHVIKNLSIKNYGYLSFFADRLAESINDHVKLTLLEINPRIFDQNIKKNEFLFEDNILCLKGSCESVEYLNDWLITVESLDFVEEIQDHIFKYNEYDEMGNFSFRLKVNKP